MRWHPLSLLFSFSPFFSGETPCFCNVGRLFDSHILDMLELGVIKYSGMERVGVQDAHRVMGVSFRLAQ